MQSASHLNDWPPLPGGSEDAYTTGERKDEVFFGRFGAPRGIKTKIQRRRRGQAGCGILGGTNKAASQVGLSQNDLNPRDQTVKCFT